MKYLRENLLENSGFMSYAETDGKVGRRILGWAGTLGISRGKEISPGNPIPVSERRLWDKSVRFQQRINLCLSACLPARETRLALFDQLNRPSSPGSRASICALEIITDFRYYFPLPRPSQRERDGDFGADPPRPPCQMPDVRECKYGDNWQKGYRYSP